MPPCIHQIHKDIANLLFAGRLGTQSAQCPARPGIGADQKLEGAHHGKENVEEGQEAGSHQAVDRVSLDRRSGRKFLIFKGEGPPLFPFFWPPRIPHCSHGRFDREPLAVRAGSVLGPADWPRVEHRGNRQRVRFSRQVVLRPHLNIDGPVHVAGMNFVFVAKRGRSVDALVPGQLQISARIAKREHIGNQ